MTGAERFILFRGLVAHAGRDAPRAFALNATALLTAAIPKVMAVDGPELLEVLTLLRDALDADGMPQFEDATRGKERVEAFAAICDDLSRAGALGPSDLQAVRDAFEAAGIVAGPTG